MSFLRSFIKLIPTLITAVLLSVGVWILAVTSSDPIVADTFPRPVAIEIVGQDAGLVITSPVPDRVTLKLSAPQSIWNSLNSSESSVRAMVDISSLGSGTFIVPVQVQIGLRPVQIVSYTPTSLTITLERIQSRKLLIRLVEQGQPAVGFQEETPVLSQREVTISGPESIVQRVQEVRATLDITQANQLISRLLNLQAFDAEGVQVNGVTITPDRVNVSQMFVQLGGYRNVVVKVISSGNLSSGYRLTSISAFPPVVTVFSSDPKLVDNLPGYIETRPVDLSNAKYDIDQKILLNLPAGVSVVGDQSVQVTVGVAAIQSSLTLSNMKVEVIGLSPLYSALVSPAVVDVIISGPLPILDQLKSADVRVILDLTGLMPGISQQTPKVELPIQDLKLESILPGSIEVTIVSGKFTPTP